MGPIIALLVVLVPVLSSAGTPVVDEHRVVYTTSGLYADVMEDLNNAILTRGMVVSNASHVGEMLKRTGGELGEKSAIFHAAEVIESCSAVISRRALAADPHSIVYCPYKIAVYALPGAPQQVYIAHPRLYASASGDEESKAALQAVEDMLRNIIEEVVE